METLKQSQEPFVAELPHEDAPAGEALVDLPRVSVLYPAEDEVGMGRPRLYAGELLELGKEPLLLGDKQVHLPQQYLGVLQRREQRRLRRDADVVWRLDVDDVVHEPGAHETVADAQARQPRPLAQRSEHDQVLVLWDETRQGLPGELVVGLVDDHDGPGLQELPDVGLGDEVAGRVVRRAEEHDLGALVDGILDGWYVNLEGVVAGHEPDIGARHPGAEAVHAERRVAVQHRVARRDEQPQQQVYQLVAARARDDVALVEPCVLR